MRLIGGPLKLGMKNKGDLQSYHWAYSGPYLPPAETFKKVAKYRVPSIEKLRIVAEAYCLRHGSSGKVIELVDVKK